VIRVLKLITSAALWGALGAVLVLAAATTVPGVLGLQAFSVMSGSMEPALKTGGTVLDERIRPLDARPGDVVTFNDPNDHGRLITHRVRDVSVRGGDAHFVTKGDANAASERWKVPLDERIGRVAFHMPYVGYPRVWASGAIGRVAAVSLLILWALLALVDVWRSPGRRERPLPGQPELESGTP
jgi:signal peptidase I